MSLPHFNTLEVALMYYETSSVDPEVPSSTRYWHSKVAKKIRDDIGARDAGYPFCVQRNVTGFEYTQGYFSSLYHARLFIDTMPPDGGGEKVEVVHNLQVVYTRPLPYQDPTICHNCGKKLPDGCGGVERDDLACLWDQPSRWPEWMRNRR